MITVTKKKSLFLSMYHTVWTLHKTKTARLVVTLYRHITDKLPTSYRHITNCRPTVGRLSADCRPTDSLYFGEKPVGSLLAVCNSRPTVGRQTANRRPTVGQQTADRRPTVGRQSADRFFGELFFTITQNTAGVHYVVLQVCCDVADISYICCEKSTIKSAINSSEDKQKYTFTYHEHDSKLLNDWKAHVKAENFNVDVHKKDKSHRGNHASASSKSIKRSLKKKQIM